MRWMGIQMTWRCKRAARHGAGAYLTRVNQRAMEAVAKCRIMDKT